MQTFISILRGINVSGQKKILMTDLKALYEALQFREARTYIQSGNVVFKSDQKLPDALLAKKIEEAILKQYHFDVPVIIRSAEEIRRVILKNPFLKDPATDLKKLHVTFLSEVPGKSHAASIENMDFSPDRLVIDGTHVYLHIPESYGLTKLSNQFFEKKLQVTATTRNWNTVLKLSEMAS